MHSYNCFLVYKISLVRLICSSTKFEAYDLYVNYGSQLAFSRQEVNNGDLSTTDNIWRQAEALAKRKLVSVAVQVTGQEILQLGEGDTLKTKFGELLPYSAVKVYAYTGPLVFLCILVSPDRAWAVDGLHGKTNWNSTNALHENVVEEADGFRKYIESLAEQHGFVIIEPNFSGVTQQAKASIFHRKVEFEAFIDHIANVAGDRVPTGLSEALYYYTGHGGAAGEWVLAGNTEVDEHLSFQRMQMLVSKAAMPSTVISDRCNSVSQAAIEATRATNFRFISACAPEQEAYCGNLLSFFEEGLLRVNSEGNMQSPCCAECDFHYKSILQLPNIATSLVDEPVLAAVKRRGQKGHKFRRVRDTEVRNALRELRVDVKQGKGKQDVYHGGYLGGEKKLGEYRERQVPRQGSFETKPGQKNTFRVVAMFNHQGQCLQEFVTYTHYGDTRQFQEKYPDRMPNPHKATFFQSKCRLAL